MVSFAAGIAAGVLVLALLCWCAAAGFRNGDRPADTRVSAVLRDSGQPDESRPVVVATVQNRSGTPVLVGLSVRPVRLPAWLAGPLTVTVPRRTARKKFRPTGYATVSLVLAGATVRCTVPAETSARRYLLTAAVGQAGGRLRLHRLHVPGVRVTAPAKLSVRLSRTDAAGSPPARDTPWDE